MRTSRLLSLLLMICSLQCLGQLSEAETAIKASIDQLIAAMRDVDSLSAQEVLVKGAVLSSIYVNKEGKAQKRTTSIKEFITAIGTPRTVKWDEKIWSYDINIDYPMAIAWTEYSFYIDERLSHCGVNVFELIHIDGNWAITSITDTRRIAGCKTKSRQEVNNLMDRWHHAAAVADEDVFFGAMTPDGIYIGTDASERWRTNEMKEWSKEYFDRESAWNFIPKERNITFNNDETIGWFDEILETWMGDCRGSGVVIKTSAGWKIKQYHLAIAVPNDKVDGYLELIGKPRDKKK